MPENPIIQEGGSGRRMGSIGRIITFASGGNDLWVPASERLTAQKFISKNGVYVAKDEELFAFSKLIVNVYGGAPGMTVPTTPTGPYGVETPTGETPAVIPAIPGGPGSSISGIDPTDGQQYTATVNPDGTINMIRCPASIRIVTPPAKLTYGNGDRIDYNGLVIELLDAQGNVFTDSNYPNGQIVWTATRWNKVQGKPYLNLNVDTTIETAQASGPVIVDDVPILSGFWWAWMHTYSHAIWTHFAFTDTGLLLPYDVGSEPSRRLQSIYAVAKTPDITCGYTYVTTDGRSGRSERPKQSEQHFEKNGNPVYYNVIGGMYDAQTTGASYDFVYQEGFESFKDVMYDALYGDPAGNQDIPVSWTSPYNGATLTASFKITVQGPTTEGGETGDSGGDSGGGAGHGF